MVSKLKLLLSIVFALNIYANYYAQQFNFWNYTEQNGLVGSKVNTVYQDNLGFLWVGTESGVSKYDGTTFVNFDKFDNLSSNSVTHIIQDKQGIIWFGHSNGSLTSYTKNKFSQVILNEDSIIQLSLSINGNLIVVSKKEVYTVVADEKQLYPFYIKDSNEFFLFANQTDSNAWTVATTKRLVNYEIKNNLPFVLKEQKSEQLVFLYTKSKKHLFLASLKGDLYVYNYKLNLVISLPLKREVKHIAFTNDYLYVSSEGNVLKLKLENDKIKIYKEIKVTANADNKVVSTFVDKEKSLWVCTQEKGLFALPNTHFELYSSIYDLGKAVSYSKQSDSVLLVVYQQGIVEVAINKEGRVNYKKLAEFKNKKVNNALITNKQEIWYGTNNGLFLRFANSYIEYEFKEFKNKRINDIYTHNENTLIATENDIYIYKPTTNKVSSFSNENNIKPFVVSSFTVVNGVIYGLGKGNVIKISENKTTFLFNEEDKEIIDLDFTSITLTNNGAIYIGTQGKGILSYKDKNIYINLTEKLKLPYRYVLSLYSNDSILWFTTKLGVVKTNLTTGDYHLYGQRYIGEANFLANQIVCLKNSLFFLSGLGLVTIEDLAINELNASDVKITNFQVSGVNKELEGNIELTHGNYPIKIDFESISLKEKIYFQYQLKGYSPNWSDATTLKSVVYNDLPPGKYTFNVRTVNPKNNSVGSLKSIKFVINIPFWKTAKFIVLMSVLSVLIILIAYLIRVYRLRIQKRKLQKQVELKTFQLSVQKKQLEQFSYSLSHDLKNPVNNIKGLVEILSENNEDNIIKMLSESTEILESKILEALNSIKRTQSNSQEIKEVIFEQIHEKVMKSLLMLVKENNAKVEFDFLVKKIDYEENLIESILYNLISNAIKYKHPDRIPEISVYTEQINDLVRLTVSDNGLGLDLAKEKDNLFSIFKRVHTHGEGTGIGLYMIKQMVEINGGSIDVESEIGGGTKFKVYLKPLKAK